MPGMHIRENSTKRTGRRSCSVRLIIGIEKAQSLRPKKRKVTSVISELLKTGAANAICAEDLMEITGLDKRTVQARIEQERNDGALICANAKGYYLPANWEEIRAYTQRYEKMAKKMLHTIRHFREKGKQIDGQLMLRA